MILVSKPGRFHLSPDSLKTQLLFALKPLKAFINLCSHAISGLELRNAAAGVALVAFLKSD